jgi:hypothetical protein
VQALRLEEDEEDEIAVGARISPAEEEGER